MTPATCRSCGAAITWAETSNGRAMPVDTEPNVNGNIVLLPAADPREPTLALVLDKTGAIRTPAGVARPPASERHTSHFATCVDADEWRRTP